MRARMCSFPASSFNSAVLEAPALSVGYLPIYKCLQHVPAYPADVSAKQRTFNSSPVPSTIRINERISLAANTVSAFLRPRSASRPVPRPSAASSPPASSPNLRPTTLGICPESRPSPPVSLSGSPYASGLPSRPQVVKKYRSPRNYGCFRLRQSDFAAENISKTREVTVCGGRNRIAANAGPLEHWLKAEVNDERPPRPLGRSSFRRFEPWSCNPSPRDLPSSPMQRGAGPCEAAPGPLQRLMWDVRVQRD